MNHPPSYPIAQTRRHDRAARDARFTPEPVVAVALLTAELVLLAGVAMPIAWPAIVGDH